MRKTIELNLPLGYRLEDKVEYTNVWEAEQILLSKKGRRYTKAVRHDTDAQLHSRWLVCPYCGKQSVANANAAIFNKAIYGGRLYAGRPSKGRIAHWASMQISLFEDRKNEELLMAPPVESPGEFVCPECERVSYDTSASRQVVLTLERKRISVRCEVVQLDELLALEWVKKGEISLCFPVFEVLTFDCQSGRVHVKVEDAQGNILCQRDVSACPDRLKGGAVHKVLTCNKVALRNLKRLFRDAWEEPLPYTWKQLDLSALFKMTMFVGYPERFYDCIPYVQNSFRIDRGFSNRARQMHFARDLNDIYQKGGLPPAKSVRRILFSNPGLFFYVEEIRGIWDAVGDCNLVSRFLSGERVYEILSSIHMRPGVLEYIRDYSMVKGGVQLLSDMERHWERVQTQAIDYCCMGPRMRLEAQHSWGSRRKRDGARLFERTYSVPLCRPDEAIRDCTIKGYTFTWLRSSNDYAEAARQLQNCLGGWQTCNAPVVGVHQKGRYVAAIEVHRGHVVQARGPENRPLEYDPVLLETVQMWAKRFHLDWDEEKDPEEGIEFDFHAMGNLPF